MFVTFYSYLHILNPMIFNDPARLARYHSLKFRQEVTLDVWKQSFDFDKETIEFIATTR